MAEILKKANGGRLEATCRRQWWMGWGACADG
ncbi:hypothetical protein V6Z11_1Z032600 [Gossypium hirsutum]